MGQEEYIVMEPDFREEIKNRYTKPYKRNIRVLVSCLLFAWIIIVGGQLWASQKEDKINFAPVIVVTIGFLFAFWLAYPKFRKMNIHYLQDADFGMIVKEQVAIIKVLIRLQASIFTGSVPMLSKHLHPTHTLFSGKAISLLFTT